MALLLPKETISSFQSVTDTDKVYYSDSLFGKRWLIAILGADETRKKSAEIIESLYKQTSIDFELNVFTISGLFLEKNV